MNQRKLNNKGFSLVELIVVIAIMAVLIGLLAPQFIKYVNRSRYSTDIKNGQEIATITQTLLADRVISGNAINAQPYDTGNSIYEAAKTNNLATEIPTSKVDSSQHFLVDCDPASGSVKVYVGTAHADNEVYPSLGKNYKDYK